MANQIAAGDQRVVGAMIESHLHEGRQDIVAGQPLAWGVSVTDACISLSSRRDRCSPNWRKRYAVGAGQIGCCD